MRPPDTDSRSARQVVKVIRMGGVLFIVDYLNFVRRLFAVARSHGESGKAQLATTVPTVNWWKKCAFPEDLLRFV